MLGIIVAIRNFIIALLLSWIGISFSAPIEEPLPDTDTPEDTVSQDHESRFKIG